MLNEKNHLNLKMNNLLKKKSENDNLENIIRDLREKQSNVEKDKKILENNFTTELSNRDFRINDLEIKLKFSEQINRYLNSRINDLEESKSKLNNNNFKSIEQIFLKENSCITNEDELIGMIVSKGKANGCLVFRGPRGGKYYKNCKGNKTYIQNEEKIKFFN